VLGAVAWTVAANTARAGYRAHQGQAQITAIYHHALAAGFSREFLVAAAIMLLAAVIAVGAIRTGRDAQTADRQGRGHSARTHNGVIAAVPPAAAWQKHHACRVGDQERSVIIA